MLEEQHGHDCYQRRPARSRRANALMRKRGEVHPRLKKYRASSRGTYGVHFISTKPEFLNTEAAKEKPCIDWSPYAPDSSISPVETPGHEHRSASTPARRRDTQSRALAAPLRMRGFAGVAGMGGRSSSAGETRLSFKQLGRPVWKGLSSTSDWTGIATPRRSGKTLRSPVRLTGPVQFIVKLLDTWKLEPDKAAVLLGFEESGKDHVERILRGREPLSGRDAKDRVVHLLHVRGTLSALFQDREVENEWLREPRSLLHDKSPMDLLLEGSMENLLLLREYVETMAGR